MPWSEHLSGLSQTWQQGEHVTLVGPTGAGKTYLARALLPLRQYVVVAASKPRDPLIGSFARNGYRVAREWPTWGERIVLHPRVDGPEDVPNQARQFDGLLREAYSSGGWCLFIDEAQYLSQYLKLSRMLELLWIQGRSMNVTMVAATQRPRHVPLAAFSQATHLYLWRNRDRQDLRRLSEISGAVDINQITEAVQRLGRHECLYVDARRGTIHVTQAEAR